MGANEIVSLHDKEIPDIKERLKNFVTQRLILETDNEDPKIRVKSLELLGNIGGVFVNKTEVIHTTRTISEIEIELKKTLQLYSKNEAVDAEFDES